MMKGILLSVVLLACMGIGRAMAHARKKRLETIADLLAAMRVLRLRMLNSHEPVGVLLCRSESQLFCDIGNGCHNGNTLEECWLQFRANAKQHVELSALSDQDLHALDEFFRELGKSSREEQNLLFSRTIDAFEEQHGQAKGKYADGAKLFTALGTLIGIALCVLMV